MGLAPLCQYLPCTEDLTAGLSTAEALSWIPITTLSPSVKPVFHLFCHALIHVTGHQFGNSKTTGDCTSSLAKFRVYNIQCPQTSNHFGKEWTAVNKSMLAAANQSLVLMLWLGFHFGFILVSDRYLSGLNRCSQYYIIWSYTTIQEKQYVSASST